MKTKRQIPKRGLRQRIDLLAFRLKIRKTLKNEPIELLLVTKEELNNELEIRNKQMKGQ